MILTENDITDKCLIIQRSLSVFRKALLCDIDKAFSDKMMLKIKEEELNYIQLINKYPEYFL